MKVKAFASITLTLFLVTSLFYAIPVKADPDTIKIGIFGPMRLIQGVGMLEGAQIAKEYIDTDPISIGGTDYTVELVPVDSALGNVAPEPTTGSGYGAMTWLLGQNPDLIVGGFRSEAVFGGRDLAMDAYKIWFICGAATNHIINCEGNLDPDGPLGPMTPKTCHEYGLGCNYDNYAKYRYQFRNTPPNVTNLLQSLGYYAQAVLMPKLIPLYVETDPGPCQGKVRVAVIAESAMWCDILWDYFTTPGIYQMFLGPYAYVDGAVSARVAPDATDVSTELTAMGAAGVRLIVEILSGDVGRTVQTQWYALGIKSALFGINVLSQMSETWDATGGGCEYEAFLATTGFRTPLSTTSAPYTTTELWDLYLAHSPVTVGGWNIFTESHKPIYTSWGTYQTIIGLKDILETAGVTPPFNTKAKSDALIPYIETSFADGVLGKFRYTSAHIVDLTDVAGPSFTVPVTKAAGVPYYRVAPFVEDGNYTVAQAWADAKAAYAATYDPGGVNPDMVGALHDVYSPEVGPFWSQGYVRTLVVQWQAGRHEVVFPLAVNPTTPLPYVKRTMLSRAMYPYPSDVSQTAFLGTGGYYAPLDGDDIIIVGAAFGTTPGAPRWQRLADVNNDGKIDGEDHSAVTFDQGKEVSPLPLPYCSEGGRLHYP